MERENQRKSVYGLFTFGMRLTTNLVQILQRQKSVTANAVIVTDGRYKYSKKNYKSTEDNHETNHINNEYSDTNMNTRKMHNT